MKKLTKKMICLSLCFYTVIPFFAQSNPTKKITLEDAINLALENNIKIKQSKMDLDLLQKSKKYSWNSVSPSFNVSSSVGGSTSGLAKKFSDTKKETADWTANGSVSLRFAPALATTIRSAKLAYESGELSYEKAERDISKSVAVAFYKLVYFNENLELNKRKLETAKQTYEANKSKYNQGRLSELQLLNSQYSYESQVPSVENLKTSYQSELDSFKLDIGLDVSEQIELEGSLLDVDKINLTEDILNLNIEELPSIVLLKKDMQSAQNKLTAAKYSAYGPSVSFSGGVSSRGGIKPSGDPSLSLSYSVSLNIPLDGYMPWSTTSLGIDSQKESIEKSKLSFEQTKATTALNVRNMYNEILQTQAQLKLFEKNVELAQKNYDMTLSAYNVGSTDLLSLHTAEDNLYSAKYNVQDQRYKIICKVLDLENLLGMSLRG